MLAVLTEKPFDDKDWIFEIKFDGYRMIAYKVNQKAELSSRNTNSFNTRYPQILKRIKKFGFNAVLDGEITVSDDSGRPSFQLLQNYHKTGVGNLVYYVFDILWYQGYSTEELPLIERKQLLKKILPESPEIQYSEHMEARGKQLFETAQKNKLEGIIAKKADGRYYENTRSGEWLKIKTEKRQEAVICGFTEPRGSRKFFGSLILGVYENKKLVYTGHTGTGFDERVLKSLFKIFKKYITRSSPFENTPKTNMPAQWMKPELVCEVKFSNWTSDGIMRHPVFMGLRDDKNPRDVIREK